jgi:tetratricopeptide (TPR) repeat protein
MEIKPIRPATNRRRALPILAGAGMLTCAWIWVIPDAPGAERVIAEREAKLVRLGELARERRWRDIVQQFELDDFAAWPAESARQASEALTQRGLAYSQLKEGQRAAADLRAAAKLDPKNVLAWMTLGDNFANNLNQQEHALAAYRQSLAITGTTNGWQSLSTALSIVRILTDQVETDAALAALRPYDDLQSVAPVWRIRLLRAYGHVYAAQGKEQESLTKFREALQLESQP